MKGIIYTLIFFILLASANEKICIAQEIINLYEGAADWNLDPYRIGCMGFSAGGGVIFNAITDTSSPETVPDFIVSVYGPSLNDLQVPEPAPPLFIAVESGHMNVAAGCLALFNEWQAAGGSAEIHIYGQGNGPFVFTGNPLPSDSWKDSFLTWLKAEGF